MRALTLVLALAFALPAAAEESGCLAAAPSRYAQEVQAPLGRVLALATQNDVTLSFDEADALFGKRTEVRDSHDRYANIEVSHLLARMERYSGIAVLTTNMRRTLAAGFDRRARYAGIVVLETEGGARVFEFSRAERADALAYAEASLRLCPVSARRR